MTHVTKQAEQTRPVALIFVAPMLLIASMVWMYMTGIRADESAAGLPWFELFGAWWAMFTSVLATAAAAWAWLTRPDRATSRLLIAYALAVVVGAAVSAALLTIF